MKVLKVILLLVCAANAAEIIIVDDRPGEGDFTTIQAAEMAAGDGDTIVIMPSSDSRGYREEVTVTTPNLTIRGSKSGKRRDRTLKKKTTTTKKGSSKNSKQQGTTTTRDLKGGKGGKGGDDSAFPFDALDKRGLPSMSKLPDCPEVFLDGCDSGGSCSKDVLTISATGVTIENIYLRHGGIIFASGSDGSSLIDSCILGDGNFRAVDSANFFSNSITISNNFFRSGLRFSANLFGNNHVISNNLVVPCDDGFTISGDDGLISNNKIFGCNNNAATILGDRGTIQDNEIVHTVNSIRYRGADGIVTDNRITGANLGIVSSGDNPTIAQNTLEFIQEQSIRVDCKINPQDICTGGTISHNKVMGGVSDNEGFEFFNADNFIVEYNTISLVTQVGLLFGGNGSTIRSNTIALCAAEDTGTANALEINGDDNIIEDNILNFNSYDGLNQRRGNNNVYRRNTVNGSGRAGIRVQEGTGTVIIDNTVIDTLGEGISIEGGSGTMVRDNEVTNSRIDICNNVAGTVEAGNTFTTGGFATPCESGLTL